MKAPLFHSLLWKLEKVNSFKPKLLFEGSFFLCEEEEVLLRETELLMSSSVHVYLHSAKSSQQLTRGSSTCKQRASSSQEKTSNQTSQTTLYEKHSVKVGQITIRILYIISLRVNKNFLLTGRSIWLNQAQGRTMFHGQIRMVPCLRLRPVLCRRSSASFLLYLDWQLRN